MCPEGYQIDTLTDDCIPDDIVPDPEVTSTITLTANVETSEPTGGVNHDYIWIMYIAVAFIVMVMIVFVIIICIKRRIAATKKANNPVEVPEEYTKLNGNNSKNKGIFFQENNSNSQVLSGISKDSVIMKIETGNTGHPNSCPVNASTENHLQEYNYGVKKSGDHSFPLPATELGATVLVTTKTIQIPSAPFQC